MLRDRWALVFAILLLSALPQCVGVDYSLLPANTACSDALLPGISSSATCFNVAAPSVSLGSVATEEVSLPIIQGCFYLPDENKILFSALGDPDLTGAHQFICEGIATTTSVTRTSTLTSETITTTLTRTGAERGTVYSLVDPGKNCQYYQLPDIDDEDTCRVSARDYVGLADKSSFTLASGSLQQGCFYTGASAGDAVIFNPTVTSVQPTGSAQAICAGIATTTTKTLTRTFTSATVTETTTLTSTTTAHTYTETYTTTTNSTTSTAQTTTETSTSTLHTTTETETSTITQTYTTGTPGGFVGDDPLTVYNNVLKSFWLPEGAPALLLRTPEMNVHGDVFRHGTEQWINRLVVKGPAGEPVLQVAVKNDIADFNWTDGPHDSFETLDVTFDWLGDAPLKTMPPPSTYAYRWADIDIAVGVVPGMRIGNARPEIVVVDGRSARIVVIPTAATEFENQPQLAVKYTHLDFVLQVHAKDTCEGILPELWGIKPLSNGTQAMLNPPQVHEES